MMKIKENIYLICEGITEVEFVEKIKSTFESKYNVIMENAQSGDRIVKKYKNILKMNPYAKVLIMIDLDNKRKIKDIHNLFKQSEFDVDKTDIYFVNPTFELIFVMCKRNSKPITGYKKLMKDIYGIDEYDKSEKQIKKIVKQITKDEIMGLMVKLQSLSHDDSDIRSSNYDKLFKKLFIIK